MKQTDDKVHRALAYVDGVSRQGYTMTVGEFNAYVARPGRAVTGGV